MSEALVESFVGSVFTGDWEEYLYAIVSESSNLKSELDIVSNTWIDVLSDSL